jgi:signal transduction histidine kinase/integral membrane sensor domain MASE1/CheY-like chemotaxis protein
MAWSGDALWETLTRRSRPSYLLLAMAYLVTGKLAMLLAVPPSYGSPVFPPAGISVAGMLIGGRATLPWTFLGSFLLNLWTDLSAGHAPTETSFVAAVTIAVASLLQAAIGGTVLRYAIGYPTPLDNGHDLARFLFLSPAVCLTSATLSLGALTVLGLVQLPDLATSWVSWWIGDTLGVLIVLPLILVIAGEPRSLWRSRIKPVALPMLLFFALFVAIFVRVSAWEQEQALLEFRLLSREVVDKINAGLAEQQVFLEQLERAFTRPAPVFRADFQHLAKNLLGRFPMIQAVKWAPRIDLSQRAAFEAEQQTDMPGFEIREIDDTGERRRATERDRYYPVTYIEPLAGNEQIVGFDLFSEAGGKTAVEETIKTQKVIATPPIRLVQEQGSQPGILALFAVDDGPNGPGVVSVALRMGTLVSGILAPVTSVLGARVIDLGEGKPLYSDVSPSSDGVPYNEMFAFGGRLYRVETEPTASYLKDHRKWQSGAVLITGGISTGLLGALLLLSTGYARRIEREVDDRTRDLESINQRLQLEVRERERAETALHQAQRMETIGRLTGGIAHDFNNLLTVVSGNAELLHDEAADDRVVRRASAIRRAANQGERLTRQLLAFSRRQMLYPEPVDLRERTREISEMLSRSLREDIEVSVEIPADLWPVVVDPAEFELALLNLGVNARDAMPNGGRFHVAARNLSLPCDDAGKNELVGDFVAVTLSDTGTGMTAEVQARAFEPYFTTKEVGGGSGLGLSQVYGFARQSGGVAMIESEIGRGTLITLYLPRAIKTAVAAPSAAQDTVRAPVPARLLLVEDDVEVAQATTELLQDIGLEVIWARDGKAALATFQRDPTIEMVMSDIVLPGGMSGLDLGRALRGNHPDLPVLLTTGYSQYAPEVVKEDFVLIEKPYHREVLAISIQRAAERGGRTRGRNTPEHGVKDKTRSHIG